MRKSFMFIIMTIVSFNIMAQTSINSQFEQFFYSTNISSRHCGRNIDKFIRQLKSQGFQTNEIKTVRITSHSPWGFGMVMAMNSRWGKLTEGNFHENWNFHIIALHEGLVYDFSFHQGPQVLPLQDYLERMYIPVKPFMPYGPTFRIQGNGPYYTPAIAKSQINSSFVFEIMEYNSRNELRTVEKLDYNEIIKYYAR